MAISNAYPKGAPVEDFDLFVGTKAFSNRTVNYTSQGIADYLNINAKVSIGGQLSFKFTIVPNVPKTIAFDGGLGNGTAFSAINELIVSAIDVSSNNITIFLNYLNDSQILLSQQNQPNFFGHYKITGYTQIGTTEFYRLELEFIGGNGTIGDEQYYDIVSFVLTAGGPTTTPTLQQVLDNNHDLVDGNFFAGTDAGDGNTGISVIAIGEVAGSGNSGINGVFIGNIAGLINTGTSVNALGSSAGVNNNFNYVNLFGESANADEDGQTVFSKDGIIMARISTIDLTDTRKYTLPDADGTIALTSDITTPTLQDVMGQGRYYTQAVGDYSYYLGYSGSIFIQDIVNDITNVSASIIYDVDGKFGTKVFNFGPSEGKVIYDDDLLTGKEFSTFSSFGYNKLKIPFRTSNDISTDPPAEFELPNNKNSGVYTLALTSDIPTLTSDLINDGENGTSPYVTADQLPSNLNLFATDVSSDIPTYFKLVTSISDPNFNVTPVNIPTGTITTTGQFIAALATTANVLVGNPGIINLLTIGNVRRTSGTGTAEFYYEVYHRDSGGTETLISTSSKTPPINTNVYTEFLAASLLNNGTFLATDRIVVKYYADRVGSGSNPNYDFQFGGTSPVRTNFPVPASNIPLDAIPTDGSTNGVQSNGVFDALALKSDKIIQVTPVTITAGSWTLVSGLYEANYANANILATSIVDIIPSNASVPIVLSAQLLPQTDSSAGSVKLYATNLPLSNIVVTVNIMN